MFSLMLLFLFSGCVASDNFGDKPDMLFTRISEHQDIFFTRMSEQESRESTVKISAHTGGAIYGGSGFYFFYKGKPVVLTAAHVVENAESIFVIRNEDVILANVVYIDIKSDLAVLSAPRMADWGATGFKLSTKIPKVGEECFYSGFPNDGTMMTLGGHVAGYTISGDIILNSYAWSGASGSAVFNRKGEIVGVVSAIEIGIDYLGFPTMIQNIVVVAPLTRLDYNILDKALLDG